MAHALQQNHIKSGCERGSVMRNEPGLDQQASRKNAAGYDEETDSTIANRLRQHHERKQQDRAEVEEDGGTGLSSRFSEKPAGCLHVLEPAQLQSGVKVAHHFVAIN